MGNPLIGARVPQEDKELLEAVCRARGEDVSSFVRRAVKTELAKLSYYSPDVKKALGVKINENGGVQE